jgi:hypothetical protein
MEVTIDTTTQRILHNGKVISLDPFVAASIAPVGTTIEVLESDGAIVHLKVHVPEIQ